MNLLDKLICLTGAVTILIFIIYEFSQNKNERK